MSESSTPNKPKKSTSLTQTLITAFVALSVFSLLLMGLLQLGLVNLPTQQQVASAQQQASALSAASEVSSFIEQIFSSLETATQVGRPLTGNAGERQLLLQNLQSLQPAFQEVALLNSRGLEIAKVSRLSVVTADNLADRANTDLFIQTSQDVKYVSSVYIDETTNEPLVTLAVPIKNVFGNFQGALVAEANLKFMWNLVDSLDVGENGLAYVVDSNGNLLAFGDTSRVLRGENVSNLSPVARFVDSLGQTDSAVAEMNTGINGDYVLSTFVPLGTPNWAVVTEVPISEAYKGVIPSLILSGVVLLGVAMLSAGAGVYISRRVAAPVRNLTQTATRIAQGEYDLEAPLQGPTELNRLATAFNSMTAQLRELIHSLEERVVARTQRLEIVASLTEQLAGILDFDQLLRELVNQVKQTFGYYHAHVYIIDDNRQYLIMTAGAGEAGAKMKASGHRIPLNAPTSLVARAARTGEIVGVDNVREAENWLPNPLLPDAYAEMAVPIILEGQVVGVLDVQEDRIAGLDEGDANLMRSLANQVAVAIRNARLFAQVEAALAEAQAAQERYLAGAWRKSQTIRQSAEYYYNRPGLPPLDKEFAAYLEQETLIQDKPAIIELNERSQTEEGLDTHELDPEAQPVTTDAGTVAVAPIKLQNQAVGAIQLHDTKQSRQWDELELTLINAVADQVAQVSENLRLFEESRERAGREQTIRELTNRLRSAPTIERLLETAARELGQRLGVRHTVLELGIETDSNGLPSPEDTRS